MRHPCCCPDWAWVPMGLHRPNFHSELVSYDASCPSRLPCLVSTSLHLLDNGPGHEQAWGTFWGWTLMTWAGTLSTHLSGLRSLGCVPCVLPGATSAVLLVKTASNVHLNAGVILARGQGKHTLHHHAALQIRHAEVQPLLAARSSVLCSFAFKVPR